MDSTDKITNLSYNSTINLQGKILELCNPLIMGILNITDDSFYDGGKYNNLTNAIHRAEEIINQGADIIDIGACSTRPGAKLISKEEEIKRLVPVIKEIRKYFPDTIISIDTVWADVVEATVFEGANIINDISGGQFDENIFKAVAKAKAPYILMHTPTTPDKMQNHTHYENIYLDMCKYFSNKINILKEAGVYDVIIDLGFGFGKTLEDNYLLLNRLDEFKVFELPILTGISRKSMIYKALNTTPQEALNGTTFLHAFALEKGSKILRVHDVKEAKECVKLYQKLKNNNLKIS